MQTPDTEQIEHTLRPSIVPLLFQAVVYVVIVSFVEGGLRLVRHHEEKGLVHPITAVLACVAITGLLWQWIRMRKNAAFITNNRVIVNRDASGAAQSWAIAREHIETLVTRYSSRLAHVFDVGTLELCGGNQTLVLRAVHHPQLIADLLASDDNGVTVQEGEVVNVPDRVIETLPVVVPHVPAELVSDAVLPLVLQESHVWQIPTSITPTATNDQLSELSEGEVVYF